MPEPTFKPTSAGPGSPVACWRAALWLLEALPPTRRKGADQGSPLRCRKIGQCLRTVVEAGGHASRALHAEVVPGAPFLLALLWWAEDRGIEDVVLHRWNVLQLGAGGALLRAAGTRPAAHAYLLAFASARTPERDCAFSDAEIRAATLRELLAG